MGFLRGEFTAGGTHVHCMFSHSSKLGSSFRISRLKSNSSVVKLPLLSGGLSKGDSSLSEGLAIDVWGLSLMSICSSQGLSVLVWEPGSKLLVVVSSEKTGWKKPSELTDL